MNGRPKEETLKEQAQRWAGVWLDAREAKVLSFVDAEAVLQKIKYYIPPSNKSARSSRGNHHRAGTLDDKKILHIRHEHEKRAISKILPYLKTFNHIVLSGPGMIKKHLLNAILAEPGLSRAEIKTVPMGKITDNHFKSLMANILIREFGYTHHEEKQQRAS